MIVDIFLTLMIKADDANMKEIIETAMYQVTALYMNATTNEYKNTNLTSRIINMSPVEYNM